MAFRIICAKLIEIRRDQRGLLYVLGVFGGLGNGKAFFTRRECKGNSQGVTHWKHWGGASSLERRMKGIAPFMAQE